jgi:hypothetical protein
VHELSRLVTKTTRRLFLLSLAASALPAKGVDSIVSRFAEVARPILVRHFREASCVASTRVATDVLRHFRIPARPFVCRMTVRDQETGRWHVVGPGVVLTRRTGLSNFAYHLVAVAADRLLIDASADQVNRWGFRLPGVLVAETTPGFRRGDVDLTIETEGQSVSLEPIRSRLPIPLYETRGAVAEILAAMGSDT